MDLRKLSVNETSFLHFTDAADNQLYDDAGEPNPQKKVGVTLYSPGTKIYAKAQAAKNNRLMDRLKKKGKSDVTAEQQLAENAQFLADVTKELHYIERDELEGEALAKATYSDLTIGFFAEQALKHLGEWGNFTPGSTKS